MTFVVMRGRGFDERRAIAVGDAILADPRNLDPGIVHERRGPHSVTRQLTVAGVRAIDAIDTFWDIDENGMARCESASLIAKALSEATVQRDPIRNSLIDAIVAALARTPSILGLAVGTQIDVRCATPWSPQRVTSTIWDGASCAFAHHALHEVADLPMAADAGLFQRVLNIGHLRWTGIRRNPDDDTGPTVATLETGIWG